MSRRHEYFSLDEANAIIPTLEYYFRQLAFVQRDLVSAQAALRGGGATVGPDGVRLPRLGGARLREWRAYYLDRCAAYDQVMEQVLQLGVEVVDPEAGVVNFYTWCDGEEVLFSWQYGEPAIHYWLDPGEQFHQRRSLQQLFADAPGPRAPRH